MERKSNVSSFSSQRENRTTGQPEPYPDFALMYETDKIIPMTPLFDKNNKIEEESVTVNAAFLSLRNPWTVFCDICNIGFDRNQLVYHCHSDAHNRYLTEIIYMHITNVSEPPKPVYGEFKTALERIALPYMKPHLQYFTNDNTCYTCVLCREKVSFRADGYPVIEHIVKQLKHRKIFCMVVWHMVNDRNRNHMLSRSWETTSKIPPVKKNN